MPRLNFVAARSDVTEADKKAAKGKYGDVTYADEKNKKYPIDTEAHIRAAWNYINKGKNAAKYSSGDAKAIKGKIVAAWKKHIDKEGPPSAAEHSEFAMVPVKDFVVFRAGDYPQGDYSDQDLDEIVQAYSESNHSAAITVGHLSDYPDSRAPAFGWIGELKRVGSDLIASGVEMAEELLTWIKEGYYRDRSIALYNRDDSSNPTPGKLNVHHLAILGGQPPQVKGMPALAFSAADSFTEIEFQDEGMIEEIEQLAADDTIERISEEFAECVQELEAIIGEKEDDEDDEEDLVECMNAMWSCYDRASSLVRQHYNFLEKSDSIAERFMAKVEEMKEKLFKGFKLKSPLQNVATRKESDMDRIQLQEFNEKQAKLESDRKALDAKVLEFSTKEKAQKDAEAAARVARIKAQLKEFEEELIAKKYPVAKMKEDGLFAVAELLLTSNEVTFGEGKKKQPMEVLKGLIADIKPIDTSVEFTEGELEVNLADEIGVPKGMPVAKREFNMVLFAEQYRLKHLEEFKGMTVPVARAKALEGVISGRIKRS